MKKRGDFPCLVAKRGVRYVDALHSQLCQLKFSLAFLQKTSRLLNVPEKKSILRNEVLSVIDGKIEFSDTESDDAGGNGANKAGAGNGQDLIKQSSLPGSLM